MKIKRLLAFIISVAMIVGMVPTFVFAKELDLEADEPETTEAAEAEEEEEEKEEPAETEDKEDADEEKDEEADTSDDDEDLKAPVEEFTIGSAAPSQAEEKSESTSRAAVNGTIGKCSWSLRNGLLKITGKGKMPAWSKEEYVPWHNLRDKITRIYVEQGVTTIGNFAFSHLKNFSGGTIWSYSRGKYKLKSIGNYAFWGTMLPNLPAFKTVTSLGSHAFDGTGLSTVSIPKNVKKMGVYCFANCSLLKKVTINSKLKAIPNYCFFKSGLEAMSIPKKIKSIGKYAFAHCHSMTAVTIGKGVKTIGEAAFGGCWSLKTVKFAGKNVKSIGRIAFIECESLTSIVIPAKVKAIAEGTFAGCYDLASVKLPSKLKAIGTGAFLDCSSLTSIAIPGSVKSISKSAFEASGLTTVRIPGSVKTIGYAAFANTKLASVTLCSGIKTIGDYAFSENAYLTEVVIPASVTSIGEGAFSSSALANVTLNYGIKTISDGAFAATKITTITLPNSITSLGSYIFSGCKNNITVTASDKVTNLNGNALLQATCKVIGFKDNAMTVTGKTATVKAAKVRKKAQKISASKLYNFTDNGVGTHLFAKASGNKKITVSGNGVITVKKGLKKGTYTVKVKVMATGDKEYANTSWQIVTVKVKVK